MTTYTLFALHADGCATFRDLSIVEARMVGQKILARRNGVRVWLASEADGTVLGLDNDPILHAMSLRPAVPAVN